MPRAVERTIPDRVVPVFESTGEFKGLRARVNFVWESRDSWNSKRNLIADRALVARAAELGFGKRFLFGLSETYQQLKIRKQLDDYAAGGELKAKSRAVVSAAEEIDALLDSQREEANFMAIAAGYGQPNGSERTKAFEDDQLCQEFAQITRELIDDYVRGEVSEKELEERAAAIAEELKSKRPKGFKSGAVGTDIVHVAKEIKKACEGHDARIQAVDIQLAEVYGGLTTKEKRDIAQKIVDAAESNPLLSTIFNPFTVGVGASAGAIAAKVPTKYVPVIGGLAGGAIAALRRYGKEGKDRNLNQREEEVGLAPAHKKSKDGIFAKVLGKTDFAEFSYKPVSALEAAESLNRGADSLRAGKERLPVEEKVGLEGLLIEFIADLEARLDVSESTGKALVKFGEQRDENGEIVTSGLASINRDKLNLISAIAAAKSLLKSSIPAEFFDLRYQIEYENSKRELLNAIKDADGRFAKSRANKTLRSGAFAALSGMAGGFAIHFAGEGAESLAKDVLNPERSEFLEIRKEVGDINIHQTGIVDIPQGFTGEVKDGKLILKDGEDTYELPWVRGMSEIDVRKALNESGFDAEVKVETVTHVAPDRTETSISGVLSPDFQKANGLSEIKHKNFDIDFAKGRELTLHTRGGREWFIAPVTGVDEKSLVAFYQVKDSGGQWHTMLADTTDGRFNIPSEFIDPNTGKIDKISVIGYGRVYDSAGNVVEASRIVQNTDLINGGRLESMASIAFDQKESPSVVTNIIPGATSTTSSIKIKDLTKIDHVEEKIVSAYDLSKYFPPIATSVDWRVFPTISEYHNSGNSKSDRDEPDGQSDLENMKDEEETTVVEEIDSSVELAQNWVWKEERDRIAEAARKDEEKSELEAAMIVEAIKKEKKDEEPEEDSLILTFANKSDSQDANGIGQRKDKLDARQTVNEASRAEKKTFMDWAKFYSKKRAVEDTWESMQNGEYALFQPDLRDPISISPLKMIQLNWYLIRMGGYLTEEEFEKLMKKFGIKINTIEKFSSAYFRKNRAYTGAHN